MAPFTKGAPFTIRVILNSAMQREYKSGALKQGQRAYVIGSLAMIDGELVIYGDLLFAPITPGSIPKGSGHTHETISLTLAGLGRISRIGQDFVFDLAQNDNDTGENNGNNSKEKFDE